MITFDKFLEGSPTAQRTPRSMFRWFCTTGKTIGLHPSMCMGMARENSPSRSTTEPPGGFLRVDRCPRNSGKEGEKVRTPTSTLCDGLTNYQIYILRNFRPMTIPSSLLFYSLPSPRSTFT